MKNITVRVCLDGDVPLMMAYYGIIFMPVLMGGDLRWITS